MATTYTTYELGDSIAANSGGNAAGFPAQTVLVGEFDAARRVLAAADVVEVITIPAGTQVDRVAYEVLTADATMTVDIGDGATVDGYFADADIGTLGNNAMTALALTDGTPNTVTRFTGGKYYSSADTIDIYVPAAKALDTLKIRIYVVCTVLGLS